MKLKMIGLFAIIAMLYSTCTSDVYNPDVCFQENVLPIFVAKCSMSGCHNATDHKAGLDLSNYDGIMKGVTPDHPLRSKVYNSISGNNPSMPLGQKLPPINVSYIKIWIKMGAKNSSNCKKCDTTKYAYNNKIQPLMDSWCVGCHNASNAGGGYDLSKYSGVVSTIVNNKLLGALNHSPGFSPMPQNNKLSDCDISAVTKWVNGGYANN